jgi:hypothetical protein
MLVLVSIEKKTHSRFLLLLLLLLLDFSLVFVYFSVLRKVCYGF